MIISATGGGKTCLASALGIAACHNEHTTPHPRMDDLTRRLVLARATRLRTGRCSELSNAALLIIDDFLTIGIDSDAASDLFAILDTRELRFPTMIACQTGPAHWVAELPDRAAADSIVNRLANRARPRDAAGPRRRREGEDRGRPERQVRRRRTGLLGYTPCAVRRDGSSRTTSARRGPRMIAERGTTGPVLGATRARGGGGVGGSACPRINRQWIAEVGRSP